MSLPSIDDNDIIDLFNISTDSNNLNTSPTCSSNNMNNIDNIKEFFDDFLTDNQKNLNTKFVTLHFSYENPEELYFWGKYATVEELIKTPTISYINEK